MSYVARKNTMQLIRVRALKPEELAELDRLYHTTKSIRVRTRAQMILLASEQGLLAASIRVTGETVRGVLKAGGIVLSRPQHKISSPDPEYMVKKRRLKPKGAI